jgi:hypothetical protein
LVHLQSTKTPFKSVKLSNYTDYIKTTRGTYNGKDGWNNIYVGDGDEVYVASNYNYDRQLFRYCTENPELFKIGPKFSSRVKYFKTNPEIAKWLVGYLNTNDAKNRVEEYTLVIKKYKDKGGVYQLNWNTFKSCRVPDFNYYLKNYPEKFNEYLKWIEENMKNKEKFLTGINEQFELLIKEN